MMTLQLKIVQWLTCLLLTLNAVHSAANDSSNSERCYGILGCFSEGDFADLNGKPISFTPQSPEDINVTFKLYTSENPYSSIDFKYNLEQFQLKNSPFDPKKKVKFIIHGFTQSFNEMDWMGGIKDLILEGQPNRYNVFGVDWSGGAKTINYFQAVANTRVVGAAMAHFIKKLNQYSGLRFSDVHIIGHSLGAHVAGYAGERIRNPQIGRITGLDPAGPSFYPNSTSLRLDRTDAYYVDAIHTDYGNAVLEGLGLEDPVGDIDFYPNGGYRQPACGKTKGLFNVLNQGVIKGITETVSCNHNFAPKLMLINPESLTESCQFVGYQCSNYEEYEKGRCTDCGADGKKCAVLSIFGETDRGSGSAFQDQKEDHYWDKDLHKFYYKTGPTLPYCLHHYGIEIRLANNSEKATGTFTLDLEGSKRKADGIKVSESFASFKPGETYTFLVTYEKSLGSLRRASMAWTFQGIDVLNPLKLFNAPKMVIDRLIIKYMSNINPRIRDEESGILCPEKTDRVANGDALHFIPCRGRQENEGQGGASRLDKGQTIIERPHQGQSGGSYGNNNNRTQSTTPSSRFSTTSGHFSTTSSRYQTTLGNHRGGSNSHHITTTSYPIGTNQRYSTASPNHNHVNSNYQTTPSNHGANGNHEHSNYRSTTPNYYSTTHRHRPTSSYQTTPNYRTTSPAYHGNSHRGTSNYEQNNHNRSGNQHGANGASPAFGYSTTPRYSTTPNYSDSDLNRFRPGNLPSLSLPRPLSSLDLWNRRPAMPSLWTPEGDEQVRPLRVPNRPNFYSNLPQGPSDPRIKLHLGDNVGEIYRNLGERSFFTSALAKVLPVRVNQKFGELFKPSTPTPLFYTDLKAEELSKPIVLSSNNKPYTNNWRETPDRRFGSVNSRLMVKQRSQTNGKVLDFAEMPIPDDQPENSHRQNDKSLNSDFVFDLHDDEAHRPELPRRKGRTGNYEDSENHSSDAKDNRNIA